MNDAQVVVGRYRLGARIATGGMAEVFLARELDEAGNPGRIVAVKRLLPHLMMVQAVVRMFLNEARITQQIKHPNVISVFGLGQADGAPYIAMELLEGHTFAELREKAAESGKWVPPADTVRILIDACRGLDAAHRALDESGRPLGIVHRDFTPENIHVGANGSVKVIDFGIAKSSSFGSGTEPGTLKGKYFYMSPEMILGREVDHRADVFAAGVMLYEQLCGRRPFTGSTADQVLTRIATAKPIPPSQLVPSLPKSLEVVALRALEREPNDRYATLQDFITALEETTTASTHEGLAHYVASLYPPERDDKLLAIQRARMMEPSAAGGAAVELPLVSDSVPPVTAKHPVAPSPEAPVAPAPRSSGGGAGKWLGFFGAIIVVVGIGVVGMRVLDKKPPAERIAKAEAVASPGERADLLSGLHEDERATAPELLKAGSLLQGAEAAELLHHASLRFDRDLELQLASASASVEANFAKRAEEAVARAKALSSSEPRADLVLAALREKQGDLPGTIAALRSALGKKEDPAVRAKLGLLLSQSQSLDEAATVLKPLVATNPRAAAELGFVRFREERNEEALGLLRRALEKEPSYAPAHYYLGGALFRRGDTEGAVKAYRESDRLDPKDGRALGALCQLYLLTGKKGQAEAVKTELSTRLGPDARRFVSDCGI